MSVMCCFPSPGSVGRMLWTRSVHDAPATLELCLGRLLELERPGLDLARPLVGRDRHAGRRHLVVEEPQGGRDGAVAEQALAGADDQGERPDPELVDEVVREQRLDQAGAAVDLDLRAVL